MRAEVDCCGELPAGDTVRMESTVTNIGERKVAFHHRLLRMGRGACHDGNAGVCLDLASRKSRPFPSPFIERIATGFGIEPVLLKEIAA